MIYRCKEYLVGTQTYEATLNRNDYGYNVTDDFEYYILININELEITEDGISTIPVWSTKYNFKSYEAAVKKFRNLVDSKE